ncbi:DUF1934 domain-containing protein [Geomicrobium sediminis]|uniref:Uncharacterized beta-barrel protein YwiB (DUF1934 family) n=1 Tax=Geomicrobium sediminis TaxID=1347788 RepID=A0ABS2P7T0_9BACL|nr:DUF1934 domain-containing protein [Geomicrobium sediminis]MBM7631475.1 uncharacterized beta-barrel protein YwiB (DUF1934 family) [Geomicrobium sediminis]
MSEQGIPVFVTMETNVEQEGEKKEISVSGSGQLVKKSQSTFVTWNEQLEDIGEVKTVLKIQPGSLTVLRQGAVSMRQEYTPGKETEGSYKTAYATFQTLAKTEDLQIKWFKEEALLGQLAFTYDLELQGQLAGHYDVKIKIKEEQQ